MMRLRVKKGEEEPAGGDEEGDQYEERGRERRATRLSSHMMREATIEKTPSQIASVFCQRLDSLV